MIFCFVNFDEINNNFQLDLLTVPLETLRLPYKHIGKIFIHDWIKFNAGDTAQYTYSFWIKFISKSGLIFEDCT